MEPKRARECVLIVDIVEDMVIRMLGLLAKCETEASLLIQTAVRKELS